MFNLFIIVFLAVQRQVEEMKCKWEKANIVDKNDAFCQGKGASQML